MLLIIYLFHYFYFSYSVSTIFSFLFMFFFQLFICLVFIGMLFKMNILKAMLCFAQTLPLFMEFELKYKNQIHLCRAKFTIKSQLKTIKIFLLKILFKKMVNTINLIKIEKNFVMNYKKL